MRTADSHIHLPMSASHLVFLGCVARIADIHIYLPISTPRTVFLGSVCHRFADIHFYLPISTPRTVFLGSVAAGLLTFISTCLYLPLTLCFQDVLLQDC